MKKNSISTQAIEHRSCWVWDKECICKAENKPHNDYHSALTKCITYKTLINFKKGIFNCVGKSIQKDIRPCIIIIPTITQKPKCPIGRATSINGVLQEYRCLYRCYVKDGSSNVATNESSLYNCNSGSYICCKINTIIPSPTCVDYGGDISKIVYELFDLNYNTIARYEVVESKYDNKVCINYYTDKPVVVFNKYRLSFEKIDNAVSVKIKLHNNASSKNSKCTNNFVPMGDISIEKNQTLVIRTVSGQFVTCIK